MNDRTSLIKLVRIACFNGNDDLVCYCDRNMLIVYHKRGPLPDLVRLDISHIDLNDPTFNPQDMINIINAKIANAQNV